MGNKFLTTVCCVSMMQIPLTIGSAAKAEWESSANVGVFSEYRFRELSKLRCQQYKVDLTYLIRAVFTLEIGTRMSSLVIPLLRWIFTGYAFDVGELSIDIGDLYYYYPITLAKHQHKF